MTLSKSVPLFTVDQYLALERSSEERHEFLDGQIYAMAGESDEHADITVNLVAGLANQLKGTPCRVRTKDTKVRSGPAPKPHQATTSGLYCYPDLVVICGEPQYHDEHRDVILNPTVILEVLSPSTEAFDRGEKFSRYQMWNPSLKDYLLISQDQPKIEHYARHSDDSWRYTLVQGLHNIIVIPSINCTLQLSDVFDRITFSQDA
ncbi:MAG: Uma2 family endonuclease [Cyanobacteria bacterium]|nr:Uma2 family endonuclease [Cyanobacteriota bacterium]